MAETYDEFVARAYLPGLSYQQVPEEASSASGTSSSSSSVESSDSEEAAESESVGDCMGETTSASDSGSSSGSSPAVVDEEFADFEDLKRFAEKLLGCKLSNNKRTTTSPPKWMKVAYPDTKAFWVSGTLYCMRQAKVHEKCVAWAKASCDCHLRYVLHSSDRWRIGKHCCQHNHEVVQDVCAVGVS